MKYIHLYTLFFLIVCCTFSKGQSKTDLLKETNKSEFKEVVSARGPINITRNIIQDRKGNIWIATFGGIFCYDRKSFTHVTSKVSSARFFSVTEDRKGNFWFGSIGSGVYYYDGKSFQHFTTKYGLVNDELMCIYEDKAGNIWFGLNGRASRYDGKSFRNYILNGEFMTEDKTEKSFSERQPYGVNSIIEDKAGKFWFGTSGNTFFYDGKIFTKFTINFNKPLTNVRTIIEDKKGTIWLAGNDGLWRYNGITFTQVTPNFVGFIHEDKKGNIWTTSETSQGWVLSRYDEKSLSAATPTVTVINPNEGRMLFGILEDDKGNIWFGADGVYRYDGTTITDFKDKER